jgi:hypothetical protein
VIFSATTGRAPDERQQWTNRHASLAASMPHGEHVVLADTGHAVNQERPAEIAQALNHVLGYLVASVMYRRPEGNKINLYDVLKDERCSRPRIPLILGVIGVIELGSPPACG